ncbi:unnamed protein product [Rotaria sordida]|uniref:Sarcolemmal membrane-associated protein n=2 Tax=Rotaria sordida TaxID=392033 RepID=A0A819H957_9BILA|nr:unnamed protein product [Rotaria sordida]
MDNHTSPPPFLFENTDGSIYPSDLVLNIMEDSSSSLTDTTNDSLSSSSSSLNQSFDISKTQMSYPCCVFQCKPNSHPFQERCIPLNEQVKVGRAVARLRALPNNAIFDCKVLSRQHAKIWYENGKFILQDTKSSNGTFVNSQRLGKCNEESLPFEIFSGDIIQFGVDVTENNRKTTHNCIIMEIKLYHADGTEGLTRNTNGQPLSQMKELDINTQTLYQLAQYVQEAVYREQALEQKLEYLQGVLRDAKQTSNESWQAIINEDRLLARINVLEDQIRIYRTKHPNEDTIKQELTQLTESNIKFEEASKIKLEKALLERADALNSSKTSECSLQLVQNELKHYEELDEQHKQNTQQLVQSIDEQRSLISEFEIKLRDSENRCTELENEKQQIQNNFDEYYERTHHLEELQKKSIQNGTTHDQCQEESSSKDIIIETTNSVEIPIIIENGEIEKYHQITTPSNKNDSIINHNHKEEYDNNINGIDSMNELIAAQKQIVSLRENLNETMDFRIYLLARELQLHIMATKRLVSTEDSYQNEQKRYRSLKTEYELINDELIQLKIRFNKEKNDNNELSQQQQNQFDHLSKLILSKRNKHNQLLIVYICFFLCCYLLIFFLFFFLLSW